MTGKEVTTIIANFLNTQDPKIVSRLAANLLLDIYRFSNIDQLDEKSRSTFLNRIDFNIKRMIAIVLNNNRDKENNLEIKDWNNFYDQSEG